MSGRTRIGGVVLLAALSLAGCVDRRLVITSEPSGARVWVNDLEVGRTPTETAFKFHGVYDVRLELEDHEPKWTSRKTRTPIYEYPPLDLLAEALPLRFRNHQKWHFELEPSLERAQPRDELEADLLERAGELRDRVN
ncbi:MAG: PEGA domain-containing protein [Phycisphaerales bacterium]|nr:MAG: PEGA domain-containing protein [Phycisphaerales bacterium]